MLSLKYKAAENFISTENWKFRRFWIAIPDRFMCYWR